MGFNKVNRSFPIISYRNKNARMPFTEVSCIRSSVNCSLIFNRGVGCNLLWADRFFCLSCQITFVVPAFVNQTDSKHISANHKDENRMLPLLVTLWTKPCSLHLKHFVLLLTENFCSVSTQVWHCSLEKQPKSCDEKKKELFWVEAVSNVLNLSSHPQYL